MADLGNQLGPLAGLGGTLVLLAALARTVGIGGAGWFVGLASGLTLNVALARSLLRDRSARLGPAGVVTMIRATLVVGVAALTAASYERAVAVGTLVTLASVALALDCLDGWVARRTATESPLGARLDGEVDAFLILALSVEVAPAAGAWVLAIGLARYAFFAAGWGLRWLRAPVPRRDWRKTVAASQVIALVITAAQVVPLAVSRVLLAVALAMLAESFGRDAWWLWRHRRDAPPRSASVRSRHPAANGLLVAIALTVVWAALVAPIRPGLLTMGSFVRLPLEGLVAVCLATILPLRVQRFVPWLLGPALGVLVLIKLLDLGFFIALDRPFNPVEDWTYLPIGVGTVGDTFGSRDANLLVVAGVLIALTAFVIPALAVRQLIRAAACHPRRSLPAVGVLTAIWLLCWGFGVQVSGGGVASTSAAHLAVDEVRAVQTDLRDRARFAVLIGRRDPYSSIPPNRLLKGLRDKDVLLVFVESYGEMAVRGTSFSPAIDDVVDNGTRELQADGFSSLSGWLTSPTFGGGSWLAHSTLQSGVWVNTPTRYAELVASKRSTLASLFRRAGWRTVADVPATHLSWPEGRAFYHYDEALVAREGQGAHDGPDRRSIVYHGPGFDFSPVPDQYALQALQNLELAKPHRRPVFSEIDLTSSHEPWRRIPPLIDWGLLGNGSIFRRLPINRTGVTDTAQGYAESIRYALRALYAFVERYGNKNTVLIVLGDHQPSRVVQHAGHVVPITIIAHDPKVMSRLASWGWTTGMLPSSAAPVWPMSAFRNRFLNAFDG